MYRKGLIKKIKVNFKFYDITAWLTNNCKTHIAQYFEISDFASHVCLQKFSVSCICNNDLLDFNRSVAESCFSISAVPFFSTSAVPVLILLVLYLIHSVSAEVSLNCISRIRFKFSLHSSFIIIDFDKVADMQYCNTGIISLIRIFGLDI